MIVERLTRRGGSPPREWGRLFHCRASLRRPRFTPTRVGTLFLAVTDLPQSPVHPHASGDAPVFRVIPNSASGSPPREWGRYWNPKDLEFGEAVMSQSFFPFLGLVGTRIRNMPSKSSTCREVLP